MQKTRLSASPSKTAFHQVFFLVVTVFLFISTVLGQGVGGTVSGRVTDPSGAIIPGVHISAQNIRTGVEGGTQSDASGYYVLQLASGEYTIVVTATGFATLEQKNVSVTVGGDVGLDFQLQVASTATVVEVHGETIPLITPNTSAVQTTVDNTLVSQIPVEVSGALRTADSFLALEPGYNGSSLNGGTRSGQSVTVDGADVTPTGFSTGGESISVASPIPSFAVQEFQVVGSNVEADVGRTSTGAIKYAFKSGTNQLHGSVFEYNRNTIYDAKTYFEPTRGVDRQNEFGFDLGGPIRRDKTFFYGYYDGFRYSTSNTGVFYSLLTPAMKRGDFTSADNYGAGIPAIYDPATTTSNGAGGFTRQQFSCNGVLNTICPNEISSVSAYFASLFPDPTLPTITNNYVGTTTMTSNSDQFLVKIDHAFNSTSRLSGSYSWMTNPQTSNCTFGFVLCAGLQEPHHGDRAIVNWNKTLTSDKVNHVVVSFNILYFYNHTGGQNSLSSGSNLNAKAGLGFVNPAGMATISAGGYYLGGGSFINKIAHSDAELGDDFTWIHGSHEMQLGFNTTRYTTIGIQANGGSGGHAYEYGQFVFSPLETNLPGNSKTGYAAASFLLGVVDNGSFAQEPSQAWTMPYYAIYAQDKWKIRSNLTLTYGLRWDYNAPITARRNEISNFDPTLPNPGAGYIRGALAFAGNGSGRNGLKQFADSWLLGFGPRVGLAYAWKPGTVLRVAYGLMNDTNSAPAIKLNQQGFYTYSAVGSLNAGVTPAFNWNSGYPAIPLGPDLDPSFANGGSTYWMPRYGARLPEVENYNVGVQQKIWGGIVIDASYVGTQSHYLYNGSLNYNQLNPAYLALGNTLNSAIGSAQAIAAGINAPYPGFKGSVAQALRPYPQYQTITISDAPVGNENYNALQIRAQKTLSSGISMLLAYTREHNITDVDTPQNYYNLKAEKAVTSYDLPQKFTAGYTYELPLGKGKLLNLSSALADRLLGGWTTSGTILLQSGTPIAVTTTTSLPAIGTARPNVVTGQLLYGPHDGRSSFNPRVDKYLNINAFTAPPPFTFGAAPPLFDSLRTFGMRNWNVALMKKFPITERVSLSLKGEFFNVLNTVNFGAPNAVISSPSFGQITTINGTPRNGQVSGTLSW